MKSPAQAGASVGGQYGYDQWFVKGSFDTTGITWNEHEITNGAYSQNLPAGVYNFSFLAKRENSGEKDEFSANETFSSTRGYNLQRRAGSLTLNATIPGEYKFEFTGMSSGPAMSIKVTFPQEDESNATWTVAGDNLNLFGVAWADDKAQNDLVQEGNTKIYSKTYTNFLADISDRANDYMRKITVDDFRGIITMEPVRSGKSKGAVDVLLKDNRQAIITNPNKSLLTTKCISVIFALADFNQERQSGNGYPLILDAPTSSFDAGKDKSFYKSISKLSSQCLIFTKSFLFKKNDEKGEYSIDKASLNEIDCPVYRIKKNQEGFDQQDLSTIETIVEPIKNTSI